MRKNLTQKQQQVLDYIARHIKTCGYPPTVREIGEAVGLSSSSSVHAHLRSLEEAGFIIREASLTRAIRIVDDDSTVRTKTIVNLPIAGRVAAGSPSPAIEDIEDFFPLPEEFLSGGEGFMLKVRGESMIEDGIKDGDYVIVRRQQTADNADIVVALVEGEATVKRLYKENGRIRLQPANSALAPMFFDRVEIVGRVVGLVRRM
jgi:repressor LexA